MEKEPSKWEKRGSTIRNMSLAMAIPSFFIGSPIGVGALGYFVAKWLGFSPQTGFLIGFFVGFGIALRETRRILRKISRNQENK